MTEEAQGRGLRRQLSLWQFTVNVLGTVVGAGVYVLVGNGAALTGGGLWLAFVLAAAVAGVTALSYAELASMYPRAGVEYEFLSHAVGTGWAPYLVGWVLTLNGSASVATLALGFGQYLQVVSPIAPLLGAVLLVVVLTVGVLLGLKLDTRANLVFTAIEVGGLLVIMALGAMHWEGSRVLDWPHGAGGVLGAAALLFFAYTGFEDASKMSEEVREPARVVPVGLLLGLGVTALLYVSLGLAVVQLAPVAEIAGSDAPLSLAVGRVWGHTGELFLALVALCSIANTVLFVLLAHSRLIFAMARGGSLPHVLTRILPRTAVPWVTTLIAGVLALALLPLGDVDVMGSISSWSALLVYASVSAALIVLRYRQPAVARGFRVPLSVRAFPVLPALAILVALGLSTQFDWQVIALGLGVTALGVLVYPFLRRRPPS